MKYNYITDNGPDLLELFASTERSASFGTDPV